VYTCKDLDQILLLSIIQTVVEIITFQLNLKVYSGKSCQYLYNQLYIWTKKRFITKYICLTQEEIKQKSFYQLHCALIGVQTELRSTAYISV